MMAQRRLRGIAICTACGEAFDISAENVERRVVTKGYDYEYYEYFIKCPRCGKEVETLKKLSDLPLKIVFQVWKKFLKMKD